MFNKSKQISSNVGWGSLGFTLGKGLPQQMKQAFKAGVHRRLGFTPTRINPSLRLQKVSVPKMIAISAFSTLAVTSHAQICKDNIPKTALDSRYELLNGGSEVKDKQTGLIWQRCSLGQTWDGNSCKGTATSHNWQQALTQASALGNGYRLPSIKELQTLLEQACYDPAINNTIFPNMQSSRYWSDSPFVNNSNHAWGVSFLYGYAGYGDKYGSIYVRAVRSSQ